MTIEDIAILLNVTYEELILFVINPTSSPLPTNFTLVEVFERFPLIGLENPLDPNAGQQEATGQKRQSQPPPLDSTNPIFDFLNLSQPAALLLDILLATLTPQLQQALQTFRASLALVPEFGWVNYPFQRDTLISSLRDNPVPGLFFVSGGLQLGGILPIDAEVIPSLFVLSSSSVTIYGGTSRSCRYSQIDSVLRLVTIQFGLPISWFRSGFVRCLDILSF